MIADDIRQFIEILDGTGDVVHIGQEVDWDLEAGAVGRRAYELGGPAVLFEKIKDYPGYRLLNGMTGTVRRFAIALGLPPDTPLRDIYKIYEERINQPIKPVAVESGPCKENIISGDEVDLFRLPAPYIHEGDGGRYIGTWDIVVSQDPETKWLNWGMYRNMVHNKRFIAGFPRWHSHLGVVLHSKYVPKKQPMPVALVLGADPICHLVATASFGIGGDEADFAGGLRKKPVALVKCETSDLLVPAHAEVVIEGEILPDRYEQEGPFGEYPGYRCEGLRGGVAFLVKAITYRDNPIMSMISLGMPPDDSSVAASVTAGISLKKRLIRHGVPLVDLYVPASGVTHLVIVSVKSGGRDVAQQIGKVFTARRADINKVIVVNDDIDVFDMDQVIHAFATRHHPMKGAIVDEIAQGRANVVTPCYTAEERRIQKGAFGVYDCTWRPEEVAAGTIPVKSSFDNIYPKEIQEKVIKNWSNYGF